MRNFRLAQKFGWGLLLGLCWLCLANPGLAGDVDSFRISQVSAIQPNFNAYVEILDANGIPIQNIQKDQLTATLGTQPLTIKELTDFRQTGQGVAYILLVDVSKSLAEKQFAEMRQVLKTWIDGMGPQDQAAIMTFGTEVKQLQDFSDNKELLKDLIGRLKPTDQDTQLHRGLAQAMELGNRADPTLPARRVIITLSDGQDDFAGGMTKQEVLDRMKVDPVPIYAIGYYQPPRQLQKEESLKTLGAFARTSGGSYFRAESNTIPQMFKSMQQRIKDVYQVALAGPDLNWDGTVRHLQMTYTQKPKVLNAGMDMRLLTRPVMVGDPVDSPPISFWEKMNPWGYVGAGLLFLGGMVAIIFMAASQKGDTFIPQGPMVPSGPESGDRNPYPRIQGGAEITTPIPPGVIRPWKPASDGFGKNLRFTVVRGEPGREAFEVDLTDRIVIGRDAKADVALIEDKEVSRQHCELTLDDGKIRIADLGSKNGTLVNGVPISDTYLLENDDLILVGKTELRFTILT
jgi:VWFA-related protein